MIYFLLKTEPSAYSIDDLKRDKKTSWTGVRNYQARNIIRDEIKNGDLCLIYHSSCEVPAIVGVGKVVREAYPDPLQFDPKSEYYDAGSKEMNPRWLCFDVVFVEKFKVPVTLMQMRTMPGLSEMRLLQRGNRLSVFSVSKNHFDFVIKSVKETAK
jgi:predicted RNA-binding protein with PUA-like domain